jgi:translation initiation factor 6 (eIF-6)
MLGFGKKIPVIEDKVITPEVTMNIKVKDFYLKRSELKTENYNVFLYLYSGTDNNEIQVITEKPSPDILRNNPVILINTLVMNNEVVFIYKKINDRPLKKISENTLIGSLVYLG